MTTSRFNAGKECSVCGRPVDGDCYASVPHRHRACHRESVRQNRAAKVDYYRAFDQARNQRPDRVAARKEYAQTEHGKVTNRRSSANFRLEHPEGARAHLVVRRALRRGDLVRAPCVVCGSTSRVHGHHEDYSRPLDVVWLCPRHHAAVHNGRIDWREYI